MREASAKIPQYRVSVWETVAVILGAIALGGVGLSGLGMKFLRNSADSQRAEAIASNIMGYTLPGESQGVIGLKIAGARVALVASEGKEPDIQLLVARIPTEQESGRRRIERILDSIALGGDEQEFRINTVRIETKNLCGVPVPVTIREGQLKYPNSPTKFTVTYRASVFLSDSRYVVNLLTNGQNAQQKAATVFDSLQCRQ